MRFVDHNRTMNPGPGPGSYKTELYKSLSRADVSLLASTCNLGTALSGTRKHSLNSTSPLNQSANCLNHTSRV